MWLVSRSRSSPFRNNSTKPPLSKKCKKCHDWRGREVDFKCPPGGQKPKASGRFLPAKNAQPPPLPLSLRATSGAMKKLRSRLKKPLDKTSPFSKGDRSE